MCVSKGALVLHHGNSPPKLVAVFGGLPHPPTHPPHPAESTAFRAQRHPCCVRHKETKQRTPQSEESHVCAIIVAPLTRSCARGCAFFTCVRLGVDFELLFCCARMLLCRAAPRRFCEEVPVKCSVWPLAAWHRVGADLCECPVVASIYVILVVDTS